MWDVQTNFKDRLNHPLFFGRISIDLMHDPHRDLGCNWQARKAANDAIGQANMNARPQLKKKSSVKPRFIQVTNPVMIVAIMQAITIGPTNLGDTFINSLSKMMNDNRSTEIQTVTSINRATLFKTVNLRCAPKSRFSDQQARKSQSSNHLDL